MRFESLVAHAFGPLVDETLELAPGMNVVYGPNEAGKSTWHAALYAGLCGMRRGGGQTLADRDFVGRHKPWNGGSAWEVSAVIARDDGVRVELRHDLATRTGTASDADMAGRDYASDIIRDGAPDGAVWLGLDRRSFLGTACVRQADIVRVLEAADSLQEVLQRAADTAGADATAAAAIDLLDKWRRERVGSARAFTRPLPVAERALEQSRRAADEARDARKAYLGKQAEVERLRATADECERVGAAMNIGGSERHPAEYAGLAAQIQTAVNAWSSRPRMPRPAIPSLGHLAAELAETDRQLARPQTGSNLWLGMLILVASVVAATLAFRYVGPELLAAVVFAFAGGGIAWWQRRSQQVAMLAERRTRIESEIEHRREDDERYREVIARRGDAEDALHRAADSAGIAEGEVEDRARALERWLQEWRRNFEERKARERRLAAAQREAADAMRAYNRARGELDQFARSIADVSSAEEAEQAATLARDRLQRLDATLNTTVEFLRRAEERVHRDIAPKLRDSVLKHLSRITGGRYTDCRIDPQSLAVEVRSGAGPWRRAEWLSHGAAEQIYLLLRMALAEHLSAPHETCPLILDDPIATSDALRCQAVLDTLLAVSESTQVILFTHDRDTRDWARQRLSEPTGRLRELDRAGIPA